MILLLASALAAPRFDAADPADAALAAGIWEELTACAGWEARSHRVVPISRALPADGLNGFAIVNERGLLRVELQPDEPPWSLAHELGHAWSQGDDLTVVEGRAELLARCVSQRRPDLVPLIDRYPAGLEAMPDLRAWHTSNAAALSPDELLGAYSGAWRLFEALSVRVPLRVLLDPGLSDWPALDRQLLAMGPDGEALLEALGQGPLVQEQVLGDWDLDGLSNLLEHWSGGDPQRWDSDGDGWWDGAPVPRSSLAVPLPNDGTGICLPWRRADSPKLDVVMRFDLPGVQVNAPVQRGVRWDGVLGMPDEVRGLAGGGWVEPLGEGALVPSEGCGLSPAVTLVVSPRASAARKEEMMVALNRAQARAEALLGPGRRLVVQVGVAPEGMRMMPIDPGVAWVYIEESLYLSADPDRLAAQAVALDRAWRAAAVGAPIRPADHEAVAAALARSLSPDGESLVAAPGKAVHRWQAAAAGCPGGWRGLIDGACAG